MKQINVAVVGAAGKMGKEILEVLKGSKEFTPYLAIARKGKVDGYNKSAPINQADFSRVDVIIDFSSPEILPQVLEVAMKTKTPLVCGTTGITDIHKKNLETTSKKIPILWAPNMSLGVAILRKALVALQSADGFDIQVEEIHHKHKKDRPSGTAKIIQADLEKITEKKLPAPLVVRGGGVFGIHKIYAHSADEALCFEHQALNRRVFAAGAVRAARWIIKKKPGLFTIEDVIHV